APAITNASKPAFLPAIAKCDDDRASLSRPVSGDLQTTANFADVVSGVPTSGLNATPSGAAGSNGSPARAASRGSRQVPRPAPPTTGGKTASGIGRASARPVLKATCRYWPW